MAEPSILQCRRQVAILESLVPLGLFGDETKTVSGPAEADSLDRLEAKNEAKAESITLSDLDKAVKASLNINLNEADPEIRVTKLKTDDVASLRQRKWECVLESNPKIVVRHLCESLCPLAPQETF
jgi:hypothetical protein